MYYPSICVDNFFNNPNEIREYALKQDFFDCTQHPKKGSWPGKRTIPLHELNPTLFNSFGQKFMSLYYDIETVKIHWEMNAAFQLCEPGQYGDVNTGWIHRDSDHTLAAGIVYLNPDAERDTGTSIYKSKNFLNDIPEDIAEINKEHYTNFNHNSVDVYKEGIKRNHELFEETITFKNVYNRLVSYDASQFHGVHSYYGQNNEPRLTLVFFLYGVYGTRYPIPNSKRVNI